MGKILKSEVAPCLASRDFTSSLLKFYASTIDFLENGTVITYFLETGEMTVWVYSDIVIVNLRV